MSDQGNGINISLREIYDGIQQLTKEVQGIGPKMSQLEKDAAEGVQALEIAKEARDLAKKHEDGLKWLWRTVGAALITAIIGAMVGFMVLAAQLSVQNTTVTKTEQGGK